MSGLQARGGGQMTMSLTLSRARTRLGLMTYREFLDSEECQRATEQQFRAALSQKHRYDLVTDTAMGMAIVALLLAVTTLIYRLCSVDKYPLMMTPPAIFAAWVFHTACRKPYYMHRYLKELQDLGVEGETHEKTQGGDPGETQGPTAG